MKRKSSYYYGLHVERGICNDAFTGCTAMPLKAKAVLRKLGYEGSFDAENSY